MTDQLPFRSPDPRTARILCAITFHYNPAHIAFLAEVLRSLAEYKVELLDVVIVTNTVDKAEVAGIGRLAAEALPDRAPRVRSFPNLADPYDLTWCHKPLLAGAFAAGAAGRYTHFIYLEGDIRLSFANFAYFVEWRERLRDVGLLPAFVRTEYSRECHGFVASDAFWPIYVPVQSHVRLGDTVMVNMPNPYNPCFILDADLADEYLRTRSFDKDASLEVCGWGIRERAALGLCLENVPPPFQSRYVVPVSLGTDRVPAAASISHLPNNYADQPGIPLGKVRMDALFKGVRAIETGKWWPFRERRRDEPASHVRHYLVSHHDTILFVDEAARRLRHAPFGIAPFNLVAELDSGRARLRYVGSGPPGHPGVAVARSNGEIDFVDAPTKFDLATDFFLEKSNSFCAGEFYLTADVDGLVYHNRSQCMQFERFRLLREDNLAGFALLQRHAWISDADGAIVRLAPQPIDFGRDYPHESSALAATLAAGALERRRDIVFGPARLRLVAREKLFEVEWADDADLPSRIVVADVSGARHGFSRDVRHRPPG